MNFSSFIKETVLDLNAKQFKDLKGIITKYYVPLFVTPKDDLTAQAFAEKLCDYFEKVKLETLKSYDKIIEKYALDLDSVISRRIEKPKKNESATTSYRAQLYYEKACDLRKHMKDSEVSTQGLLDYSRIMLCLYSAIIMNENEKIKDFSFSSEKLNLITIINSLYKEKNKLGKPRFEVKDPYTSDRSTFVLLAIMFSYMKSKEIKGEY